ncbi:MAG: E3 binding domain-containing protein [Planctomycetes bacterium]|nr:E3 binding domain-containing protein [Planctomycetota bacterium]
MVSLLTVPYLGTAEEDVLVADWLVEVDAPIRKGQAIVALETLKASFEVEAESDGVLVRRLSERGERVPLHAALGVVAAAGETIDEDSIRSLLEEHRSQHGASADALAVDDGAVESGSEPTNGKARTAHGASSRTGGVAGGGQAGKGRVPAAPAARRRARELGVDLAKVTGTGRGGMITVADVEAASVTPASTIFAEEAPEGRLDPEFVVHLYRDAEIFAALSSESKVALYRKHGARIGQGVHIAKGALILCEELVLGDDVRLSEGVRVRAHVFHAGELTQIGPRGQLRATRIVLGHNAYFAPDVEVGGGGAMDPEASLRIGSHGFVGEHVHLNPCRPIVIGDEVTISRNASIMTHSFAGSMLEGYPNRFAGITIEDGCQIGIGCTLFPGVTMGEGSILLSNSALVTSLPAGRVYAGSPAQDLKAAREAIDDKRRLALAQRIVRDFAVALAARGFETRFEEHGDTMHLRVLDGDASHDLWFSERLDTSERELVVEDLRVGLECEDAAFEALPSELCGFDLVKKRVRGELGELGKALREFLRKRGIRLEPRTWTYRGEWL